MYCLNRANFLTHPTKNAAKFINFVYYGVPISLIILSPYQSDAICGAHCGTKSAGYALRSTIRMHFHAMCASPSWTQSCFHFRILLSNTFGIQHMPQGDFHPFQRSTEVGGFFHFWSSQNSSFYSHNCPLTNSFNLISSNVKLFILIQQLRIEPFFLRLLHRLFLLCPPEKQNPTYRVHSLMSAQGQTQIHSQSQFGTG